MKTLIDSYRPPIRLRLDTQRHMGFWFSFGHSAQVQVHLAFLNWSWWFPTPRTRKNWLLWIGPLCISVHL